MSWDVHGLGGGALSLGLCNLESERLARTWEGLPLSTLKASLADVCKLFTLSG